MKNSILKLPTHELRIAKLNQERLQSERVARLQFQISLNRQDKKQSKLEKKLHNTLYKIERRYKKDLLALQELYENESKKSTDKTRTKYTYVKCKVNTGVSKKKEKTKTNLRQKTFDEAKNTKQKKRVLEEKAKGNKECVTCGSTYSIQGGHMIKAERYATALLDANIRPQCANCNLYKDGEQKKMKECFIEKYGQERLDNIVLLSKTGSKPTIEFMTEIIKSDKAKIRVLQKILKEGK